MKPEKAHEIYLDTARKLGWPIRPEVNVPYEHLSDAAKALDIALSAESEREIQELREKLAVATEALEQYYKGYDGLADALKEIDSLRDFLSPGGKQEYLLLEQRNAYEKENRELRAELSVAVEALAQILEFGNKAHADGSSQSHSFNLGLSAGTACKALSKIRGEK